MILVTQYQLQGMLAWREFQGGLRLSTTEVFMVFVFGNRFIEYGYLRNIDQQMVVSGALLLDARRRDSHPRKPEANRDGILHRGAVGR